MGCSGKNIRGPGRGWVRAKMIIRRAMVAPLIGRGSRFQPPLSLLIHVNSLVYFSL